MFRRAATSRESGQGNNERRRAATSARPGKDGGPAVLLRVGTLDDDRRVLHTDARQSVLAARAAAFAEAPPSD
jgi:hypothetical protein